MISSTQLDAGGGHILVIGCLLAWAVAIGGIMIIKTGYKTTEFWFTVILQIVGALVVLDVFTPEQGTAVEQLVGALVMVLSAFGYSLSRGLAKQGTAVSVEAVLEETGSLPE